MEENKKKSNTKRRFKAGDIVVHKLTDEKIVLLEKCDMSGIGDWEGRIEKDAKDGVSELRRMCLYESEIKHTQAVNRE